MACLFISDTTRGLDVSRFNTARYNSTTHLRMNLSNSNLLPTYLKIILYTFAFKQYAQIKFNEIMNFLFELSVQIIICNDTITPRLCLTEFSCM